MDSITIAKNDFRLLLMATAILPILCFSLGFYVAAGHGAPRQSSTVQAPDLTATPTPVARQGNDTPHTETPPQPLVDDNPGVEKYSETTAGVVERESYMREKRRADKLLKAAQHPTQTNRAQDAQEQHRSSPAAETNAYFVVQAGLFSNYFNAYKFRHRLHRQGVEAQIIDAEQDGHALYRIILNAFENRSDAVNYSQAMRNRHQLELFVSEINAQGPLKSVAAL